MKFQRMKMMVILFVILVFSAFSGLAFAGAAGKSLTDPISGKFAGAGKNLTLVPHDKGTPPQDLVGILKYVNDNKGTATLATEAGAYSFEYDYIQPFLFLNSSGLSGKFLFDSDNLYYVDPDGANSLIMRRVE